MATVGRVKVKTALSEEMKTIIVSRNFSVDFVSLKGSFAETKSRIEATNGKARILTSRNATSAKINRITSRNFVLGSSLCKRVLPGKYLI